MTLHVDWSVRSKPISLFEASEKAEVSLHDLKQLYRDGTFGQPPTAVHAVPLDQAAAIFVIKAAQRLSLPRERLLPVLPAIAGATYLHYMLTEIGDGRCQHIGGTPMLNIQLSSLLRSTKAKSELEARLPSGSIQTKRYACFDETTSYMCDDLAEMELPLERLKIIDAQNVARTMKGALPGERLYTHIA